MAEAMIQKEKAEGRWDASVNVGYMRQDFGYDLRGLTASGAPSPSRTSFITSGRASRSRPPPSEPGTLPGAASTTARRRLALVTLVRQEVTAAFASMTLQRLLEIHGRPEVARQNLEVVRQTYTLGRATLLDVIAEQRRYIDVETGYTDVLKQVYDAAVDIERAVGTLER